MTIDIKVAREAAERWEARRQDRESQIARVHRDGVASVEPHQRVQARMERLAAAATRESARRSAQPGVPAAVARIGLERVIGRADFLSTQFVELAAAVSRFVARVHLRDRPGQDAGFGTGFMVSPRLLLTNNHVFPTSDAARYSEIEFDFQNDRFGRPLPVVVYGLQPDTFFVTSSELDYTLVALAPLSTTGRDLATYTWTRLRPDPGKALLGDALNIIQHPRGQTKQIALRSNELVDVLESYHHYTTDTEPGSSGSPVFNDQWEVVALHHSGVPRMRDGQLVAKDGTIWQPGMDPDRLDWVANEGVRVSKLVEHIRSLSSLSAEQARLRDELLTAEPPHPFEAAALVNGNGNGHAEPPPLTPGPDFAGLATWTIPLRVTVDLGAPARAPIVVAAAAPAGNGHDAAVIPAPGPPPASESPTAASRVTGADEAVHIDPDYANRRGYQPGFLGGGERRVGLPRLSAGQREKAAVNRQANGQDDILLPYHHFTLVMNRERRLAFFTAVNIDGSITHNFTREADRWSADPRIGADEQTGESLYAANDLDRGHLVRRLDPAWGSSRVAAKSANDDTFHYTNCSPQHKNFNQNRTTWAGLEDYILKNADAEALRVSVFSGPVLAADDPEYRGIQLPREFWKVVVMARAGGGLSATAYLLSQGELIQNLEAFAYGAYRTFQVPLRRIEAATGLDFGALRSFDPLAANESTQETATVTAREIQNFGQIRL